MSATPPGWYDDGQHPGQHRWWNGTEWTDQYQQIPGGPSSPEGAYRAAPQKKGRLWLWLGPVLAVLALGGAAIGLWLAGVFGASPFAAGPSAEWQQAVIDFQQASVGADTVVVQFVSAAVVDGVPTVVTIESRNGQPQATWVYELVEQGGTWAVTGAEPH